MVVRTDVLTDIAAVDVIVQRGTKLVRDGGAKLDRQGRDAAGRIEHTSIDQRAGRTGIQTSAARSALLERLCVGLEVKGGDDFGEKEPRTVLGVDEAGVLPDPSEPGVLS